MGVWTRVGRLEIHISWVHGLASAHLLYRREQAPKAGVCFQWSPRVTWLRNQEMRSLLYSVVPIYVSHLQIWCFSVHILYIAQTEYDLMHIWTPFSILWSMVLAKMASIGRRYAPSNCPKIYNAEKWREMERNVEKCRETQRNVEKCIEIQRNAEKCREMQTNVWFCSLWWRLNQTEKWK